MLIGIDASRAIIAQRTGTESYSLQIIRHMISEGGARQFRLYCRSEPPHGLFPDSPNVEILIIHKARFWTHAGLGPAVRRDPPDVLFVPAHVIPWPNAGNTPSVVTIHDIGFRHYPEAHPMAQRLYLDWSTGHSARVATKVIAVSHATADDLTSLYRVPKSKIRVIHSGVNKDLKSDDNLPEIVAVRDRYGISGPYILSVGSLHARKNLLRLVEAFRQVVDVIPEMRLAFAGRPGWGHDHLRQRIHALGLENQITFCGYVPDQDMRGLYAGTRAFVFPTLYEGFGFPALEAMACGAPVACSNTSSLPEIVGEAALTFDPEDVTSIAESLLRVLTDEELRALMVRRGLERAKQFSWKSAARDTLELLEAVASS